MKIDCFRCKEITTLLTDEVINNHDVFFINEGQFFIDLVSAVNKLLNAKKKIYVSGLDGDFKQQKFWKYIRSCFLIVIK